MQPVDPHPIADLCRGGGDQHVHAYFVTTFIGPNPPPHPWIYLPFNLPWLIAPAILGLRMLRAGAVRAAYGRNGFGDGLVAKKPVQQAVMATTAETGAASNATAAIIGRGRCR